MIKIVTLFLSSLLLVVDDVAAFGLQQQATSFRKTSSLSMNVENLDTKQNVKVGVIGMGRIGLVHLEAITKAPGVTPVIVSNPTVSKAEAGKSWLSSASGQQMSPRMLV